ncbi:MAG TPA: BrxA/BrxB family bacilliredoxin [Candidatus Saccharimonadales bacterium]|nr:BrxA/BrxB family bacilliredoxin [Candidatus Saccharimonadales bacterium]
MYPELMVVPMREELTRLGVQEARTPAEVDAAISESHGTLMVVVNSICGCAAGKMRPAVRAALANAVKPDRSITVFAGQDVAATERARSYFTGQPPSSPSIAIMRGGELAFFMPRAEIEGRDAATIAASLKQAFEQVCQPASN